MDEQYLIWSNEHRAWWRPDRCGYTRDVRTAGRYSRQEAIETSGTARCGWVDPRRLPDEIAVKIQDLPPQVFAAMQSHSLQDDAHE